LYLWRRIQLKPGAEGLNIPDRTLSTEPLRVVIVLAQLDLLEVGGDALLTHALGDHRVATVCAIGDRHLGGRCTELLGSVADDELLGEQGRTDRCGIELKSG